ncbi:MAG: TrbI/VirB10 family protein [Erythrobacter sp.]
MRLAMRLPGKSGGQGTSTGADPREQESAEIIDLASRTAYPAVAQRQGKSDALGLSAGVAIVTGLGAVAFWAMNSARLESGAAPAPAPVTVAPAPVAAPATGAVVLQPDPAQPGVAPVPAIQPVPEGAPVGAVMPATNPYASPTMVFDSSVASRSFEVAAASLAAEAAAPAATGNSSADFASRVGGVGGAAAQARAMANPSTTVMQGTLIPAVLETAIDTNVPGFVRAIVSEDVRSFDGRRILVPRSSRLIGQYQSGLQGGQKRAYVIWTRLIRPDGASVSLASPAVGFDGATGIQGEVKSNFFQRFGSALLLSVVGGLSTIASSGATVVLGGGQSAAASAADRDGQIGPTVRVRQGEPIRVFTARDLDFSQVSG